MDQCPICKSSNRGLFGESHRCVSCGVVRTAHSFNPAIYNENYATNYIRYQEGEFNDPLNLCRLGLVSRWLRKTDTLLDVGCCIGEFIRFAEPYYHCIGYELNPVALKLAKERTRSPILSELSDPLLLTPVKMVTMFDVIEHMEFPLAFLKLVSEHILDKSGYLIITTPNVDAIKSWHVGILKEWKHYKPEEHLFLYTPEALTLLLSQAGFEVIYRGTEESDIRPGNPNGDLMTCVARRRNE